MNDATQPPQTPVPPPPANPEVEEGKVFAILSYALSLIGLPFFLVPLIMRNNEFSLYHAKQCLILWLAGIIASVIGSVLIVVCIGFVVLVAAWVFLLVLDIMGLMNAVRGEMKPLPVIGQYADQWFKGLHKV